MTQSGSKKSSINYHQMSSLSMNISRIFNLKWPMFTQLQISSVLSLSLLSSSDLQVWVMSKKDPVEWVDSMIFLIKRPLILLVIPKSDSMMLLAWIKANFKLDSLLIFLKIHKSIKNLVPEYQKEFFCQDLLEQVKHY